MAKKTFNQQLIDRGYKYDTIKIKGKSAKGFKGIKVK